MVVSDLNNDDIRGDNLITTQCRMRLAYSPPQPPEKNKNKYTLELFMKGHKNINGPYPKRTAESNSRKNRCQEGQF